MSTVSKRRSGGRILLLVLFVLGAGCMLASPAAGDSPGDGAVNVSVEPAETNLDPNQTVTYEVVVEGAQQGIDAYTHLDIVIENPEVAQFVDFYETANNNADGNITFSLTEIQDENGNQSETGPVLSMEAALTGGTDFDGADEHVIAEVDVEVLGDVPSDTAVNIVENPEPDEIDEPQIANDTDGNAYDIHAIGDGELAVPAEASVSLVPTETELPPGKTTSYQVVVEGAEYGIQSYDGLAVTIEDPEAGQFVTIYEPAEDNVDPGGDPPVSNSEIRDGNGNPAGAGPVAYLDADLADGAFEGTSEVVIAELDTAVTGLNATNVTVTTADSLQDTQGVDYEITSTTGSQLDPIGIDVTGNGKPAADTTGNGLLNNIDGDGAFNIFDVQALFNNFEGQSVQNNAGLFDFNSDDEASIFDVQSLFNTL